MRQYLLAVLVLLGLLSFGEAAFSRALSRSKQRPPQCIRLNDRIAYPITIPTLGTYDYNTTKPTRRFVSGPLIATRARPPHLNSGSILFEADAAIGAVMGVLSLEHLGRCDVTTTGREALLNLTVTSPKGLHLRLTPWKKIPLGNFFVFLSRGLRRVFTRVERFPYSWENNMITFFRDQNIARMDMPSFPLLYVLPDLKGKPAADLTLKQVTIRSHFKFGRLQFNNRRRRAQQATTATAATAPATPATAASPSPAPIESHVNAAKAVTQMSEATVAVNADFKHHIRSTFTGRLDLSPLGFMMTSLKTLTNVRARAYANDKRFKLMAYLPESLTIIPRRVTIEDPILVIRKKNVNDLTEFQNLEKKNTQVLIKGALEFLDTVSEAEIAFGQYVSTLTANVSFNNLVSATLRGRSKNIEGREDLDFDIWARFNAGFLTYLSRKANREIRRAARHHTGIVTNNRFARLLTKTERAIEKSQHRMDMLKRRLINGESLAITKLQKRIAKKEHTLSLLLMRLKALQQSDSGALNANNDTITHQIEVTEHLIEKLRIKSEEITGELSMGLSPTDLYVVHTLQEKLNRYVERYNASLYAPGEIAKVTKIISITQPKLSALQQTGDVAGINKVVMLQNKYSNLEREYEKAARASQRIANLKHKLEYFEAEIAAMTGGDVDAMNATATTGPAARLQKLKQNLALYQTRLKQIAALPERIAQVKQLGTQIVERIRELQTGGPAAIRPAVSNLQELQQRVAVINAEIAKINALNPKGRIASLAANLAKIRTKYFAKNAAMKKKLPTLAKYELVSLKLHRAKEMQGLLNDRAAKLKSELALTQRTFNTVPQNRNTKDIQQQVLILNKLVVDVIRGLTAQDDLKNAQKDIADLDAQIAKAKVAKTKSALSTKKASLQAKLTSLSAVANGVAAAKSSINQVSVRLLQLGHPVPPQYVHLQVQIAGINHRLRKIATILAKEPMIKSEIIKMRNSVQGDQRMALDALEQSLTDVNQHMIRLDALYFELHTLQGQGVGSFNPAFSNSIPELQNELKKVNQFISSANTMLSTEQRLKQAITETKALITQIHPTALAGDLPTLKRQIERIHRLIEKYLPHSQPSASLRYNLDEVRKEMQEAMMATPHGHKAQILQAELNALQFKLEDLEHLVKRKEIYKRRIEQIRRRMGRIQSKAGFGNEPDRIGKLQNKLAVVTAEINRKLVRLAKLRARLTYVDPHTRKIRILEVERKELVDQLNRLKDKLELMIETEESIQVPVGRVVAVFHDATSRRLQRAINFLEARVARLQTFRTRLAAKGGALDASHINIFTVKEAKSHLSFRELATTGKFRRVAVTVEVNDLTVKVYAFLNPNKPRRFARRVLRKAIKKILYHS